MKFLDRTRTMNRAKQGRVARRAAHAVCLAACALLMAGASADELEQWPDGGHIRVLKAADIAPDEAERIYQTLKPRLLAGYAKSGLAGIDYGAWRRFNTVPYVSSQHGARLVNVYGTAEAARLAEATRRNPLPVGARIVKDSISVVESGGVARGPLFMMEKMPAGFDPKNGDWRYTMIMPNGKLFGTTLGVGNSAIKFCAECHAQVEDRDFLFELPEQFIAPE